MRKSKEMKFFVYYILLVNAAVFAQLSQASRIFISEKYQNVTENSAASAYCNTSGLPNATVTWFKESKTDGIVSRYPNLTFGSISRNDGGRYICNASNGSGVFLKASTFFNVQYSPENLVITGPTTVLEKKPVDLKCKATGNPTPEIKFAKEGKADDTPSQFIQKISFPRILRSDSGRYKCIASNGVGNRKEMTITLDVQYPPEILPMPKNLDSWLHDVVELVCNASGNPEPSFTWRLPSGDHSGSRNYRFVVTNGSQFGVYRCDVRNKHGSVSFLMTLNRTRFPPDPPIITNNVTTVTSRNFTLEWTKPNEHNSNITQYWVTSMKIFTNGSMDKWECFNHDALLPLNMSFFLDWGTSYQFAVAAENGQGNSSFGLPKNITVIAEPKVHKTTKATNFAVIFGSLGGVVALIIVIVVCCKCRNRKEREPPPPCPKPQFHEAEQTHHRTFSMKELTSRFSRKGTKERYSSRYPPFNETQDNHDFLDEAPVSYVNTQAVNEHAQSQIYDNLSSVDKSVQDWEIPRERVRIEKIIGHGAFCQVAKAFVEGLGTVAVKMIKDKTGKESNRKDLLAEYNLLQHLGQHANVVLVLGGVTKSDPIMVLFEYVPYGDLLGYLRRSRGLNDTYYNDPDEKPSSSLTSQQLMRFSREIAEGMAFISENKIVHRDLAARNVLVCQGEICKITDFGMARDVANNDIYQKRSRGRLPVKWTAYEALLYGFYTTQSDVWSYGIVLYEIFTIGGCPYPGKDGRLLAQVIQNGYRMPKPKHVDEEIYALMSECWRTEPERRPTFKEVVKTLKRLERSPKNHIFMNQYEKNLYENLDDL